MAAALIQVCVDHRLNHELLRAQIRQRLGRMGLTADRVYILNDVGGNIGSNFGNTVDVLRKQGEAIVFCAVLDHDDCLAASQRVRAPMETRVQQITTKLSEGRTGCPVLAGSIRTQNNQLLWSDEPVPRYQPWSFGVY